MFKSTQKSGYLIRCYTLFVFLIVTKTIFGQSIAEQTTPVEPENTSGAAALLSEYLTYPSETLHENEAANFFMQQCRNKGLIIQKISENIGSYNFAASLYPLHQKKPNIIFLNHMDVVPAGDLQRWKYPPYSGTIADEKVWGRGAIDNKGMAIIQLSAIEKFISIANSSELPYNVTLLCVSGEETGGANGSAIAAKNFNEVFTPSVVIGEGGSGMRNISLMPKGKTIFGISIAEKGFFWLKISCKLHSAGHASVAGKDFANDHLIIGLQRLIKAHQPIEMTKESKLMFKSLGKATGGIKGFMVKHINCIFFRPFIRQQIKKNPELESVFCNTITISNLGNYSINPNQNAQEAIAVLDCRYLPGKTPSELIETIKKTMKDTLFHYSIVKESAPQYSTKPDLFYDQLKKSIQNTFNDAEVIPILFPASSDNSYYRASGCPAYGLNPMIISTRQLSSIHNYDEFIDLEDIEKGIETFKDFLQSMLIMSGSTNSEISKH